MKKITATFLFVFIVLMSFAQESLDYFLPDNVTYNKDIPTPEQFFGQQLGEWHLTHDQILFYMTEIAKISDRAIIQEYARSWENRSLVQVIFTSKKNHEKLDELKQLHKQHADPNENISNKNVPLVVSLTYGVHGNESSGPNSSVLTAYYLAAAEGDKIDKLLENTIVLVDPCLNPDGFTRHSTWANMHQSATISAKNDSRQYSEVWPGGRTNHYWFDLNRDYLLLVNPESRGRVATFHQWLPNIVTDHHEMGANSTFFFQPGVPSRNNPLTPENNYVLTHEIAKYHAQFLDEIGSVYFSEEQFDDYYFGKGSSYPDINSSVGILFEQAGFRGRYRETSNGLKSLAFGIKNQFTVSLSTLEAAMNLKDDLLNHQKEFYKSALKLADKDPIKAYVFGSETDKIKTQYFVNFLNQHQIDVFENKDDITSNGIEFKSGNSFIVPVKQKQYRLLKSIFQDVTTFADSTFYDVSTWTIPYTFNIQFAKISSIKNVGDSKKVTTTKIEGEIIGGKSSLAYLFKWDEYSTPKALYQLQKNELITKVASNKFSFEINENEEQFTYGTILIPVSGQKLNDDEIFNLISEIATETGVNFYGLKTGLSPKGIDLGSNSFVSLNKPEILLFIGGSTSSRDAGEIWHLFDQRYNIPVTIAETVSLKSIDLTEYNTVILPGGSYREWSKTDGQKLKMWATQGGNIIAYKSAAAWAAKNELGKTTFKKEIAPDSTLTLSYADRRKERSLNYISGAIFNSEMDITHPLCWGYLENSLPVFKSGTSVSKSLNIKYSEPIKFSKEPYLSGFISDKNLERIKSAPIVSVQSIGRGKLISYHENMTFRGIWLGTNKLFSNSIFFGSVIR
ncbi:MAG: zinc carboxypeptidase [Draconibacterium sp.]|nr:zinc carboxypeptidase [Draconibacterium sp.]